MNDDAPRHFPSSEPDVPDVMAKSIFPTFSVNVPMPSGTAIPAPGPVTTPTPTGGPPIGSASQAAPSTHNGR